MRDFWTPLYAAGADVILSGHRHNYERFARQTPAGVADPTRGIRQFVVGTGGDSLSSFSSTVAANSQVRNGTHPRRHQVHAAADELRLAVRAHRGPDVHGFREHELRLLAADPRTANLQGPREAMPKG